MVPLIWLLSASIVVPTQIAIAGTNTWISIQGCLLDDICKSDEICVDDNLSGICEPFAHLSVQPNTDLKRGSNLPAFKFPDGNPEDRIFRCLLQIAMRKSSMIDISEVENKPGECELERRSRWSSGYFGVPDYGRKSNANKMDNPWAYPSMQRPSQSLFSFERLNAPVSLSYSPLWMRDRRVAEFARKNVPSLISQFIPLRMLKHKKRALEQQKDANKNSGSRGDTDKERFRKRSIGNNAITPANIVSLSLLFGAIFVIALGTAIHFAQNAHRNTREQTNCREAGTKAKPKSDLIEYMRQKCKFIRKKPEVDCEREACMSESSQGNKRTISSVISFEKDPNKVDKLAPRQSTSSQRSSVSSRSSEPINSCIDLTTGHMILSYMEGYLRDENRLVKEWEAVNAYEAEEATPCNDALLETNQCKNRKQAPVPFEHSRVRLRDNQNDYINASLIFDNNPRNPVYIATPSPMLSTLSDFWQMVWEQTSVVMVCLERMNELKQPQDLPQSDDTSDVSVQYWPNEGVQNVGTFEIHLVSEHNWCDDYVVRSIYLKNLQTSETRTVTQFHFLAWHEHNIKSRTRSLLEFRRKVNRSFRGMMSPIVVHCSDGSSRTGTYILLDLVLNRICKGVKEINIAASLEHLRDQRLKMVKTKDQYEFVFTAIAQEVDAMLKTTGSSG